MLQSLAMIWVLDLNNIYNDDDDFDEDDPKTIVFVRLMAWRNRFKQHKASIKR